MSDHHLMHGDCIDRMAEIPSGSVDLVLTDIPYKEVSQKSRGLRTLDRGVADRCDIDLQAMVASSVRLCSKSHYVFAEPNKSARSFGFTVNMGSPFAWVRGRKQTRRR